MTVPCTMCETQCSLVCKKCKEKPYCSDACQKQDWPVHREQCKRKDFGAAPCDVCGDTEKDVEDVCSICGAVRCSDCAKRALDDADIHERALLSAPCTANECGATGDERMQNFFDKMETLIRENVDNPRRPEWIVFLGVMHSGFRENPESGQQKAARLFTLAGALGYGRGYRELAQLSAKKGDWNEVNRYYRMAADMHDVKAIQLLAYEARVGHFHVADGAVPEGQPRRTPDLEESFQWSQKGSKLGDLLCYALLAKCYLNGDGVAKNFCKAFKWSEKAARGGTDALAMRRCACFYLEGKGVEQSNEQAIYWFEKYLELEDNPEARSALEWLQNL